MKKILLVALSIYCLVSTAQKITTEESEQKFNSAARSAISTTIYGSTTKDAIYEWEKYLKTYKNETVSHIGVEVVGHNSFFKDIIDRPIDIYSRFEENKENKTVKMSAAIDIGASNYLKSDKNPAEIKILEKMVREFALKMTKATFEESIKSSLSFQEKLKSEQLDLEKNSKKLNEEIVEFKSKIAKLEKEVSQKNLEIESKKSEVAVQKKIVDTISVPEHSKSKAYKKTYQKLLDQKTDLEKDRGGLETEITKMREKINKSSALIEKNTQNYEDKAKEITAQKKVVEECRKRLGQIS